MSYEYCFKDDDASEILDSRLETDSLALLLCIETFQNTYGQITGKAMKCLPSFDI